MIIYVSDSHNNKSLLRQTIDLQCRNMVSPKYYRKDQPVKWALDNGAYDAYVKGKELDTTLFMTTMRKAIDSNNLPEFVVIPDIVGGGDKSYLYSMKHLPSIPKEVKKYLVIQPNMTDIENKINVDIDGVFIGGLQFWDKRDIPVVVKLAKRYGFQVHIGRVGTFKHYLWADSIGADSVDGSNPTRNNKMSIIKDYRQHIKEQQRLI